MMLLPLLSPFISFLFFSFSPVSDPRHPTRKLQTPKPQAPTVLSLPLCSSLSLFQAPTVLSLPLCSSVSFLRSQSEPQAPTVLSLPLCSSLSLFQAPTVFSLPLCSSVSFLHSQSELDEIEESSSEFSISLSFRRLVGWHYGMYWLNLTIDFQF
ncbi:hypothetical protein ACB092_08G192700 [Castanea dentata]